MAPTDQGVSADGGGSGGGDESQSLWSEILNSVANQSGATPTGIQTVVIVGPKGAGKTALVARLTSVAAGQVTHGMGVLEYTYVNVAEDDEDGSGRNIGIWTLDGDPRHRQLLRFALKRETLPHTLLLVLADLTRPWSVPEQLQQWFDIVSAHLDDLEASDPALSVEMEEKRGRQVRFWQEYTELDKPTAEGEQVLLDLDESILTKNLGIPVIVVGCKSDALSSVEKDHNYRDEHMDYLQQHIRRMCLRYGAALLYASAKTNGNCALLKSYIVYRLNAERHANMTVNNASNSDSVAESEAVTANSSSNERTPVRRPVFSRGVSMADRESVFVPAGWDSPAKIDILSDQMELLDPSAPFEDVIRAPLVKSTQAVNDAVRIEDLQVFLDALSQRAGTTTVQESEADAPSQPTSASPSTNPTGASASGSSAAASASSSAQSDSAHAPLATRNSNTGRVTRSTAKSLGASAPGSGSTTPKGNSSSTSGAAAAGQSDVLATFFNSLLTSKKVPSSSSTTHNPSSSTTADSSVAGSGAASPDVRKSAAAELDRMRSGASRKKE